MTTNSLTTAAILADKSNTLYRGSSLDRMPIADAHAAGLLVFSVNRWDGGTYFSKPIQGWYETIEEAAAALKSNPAYDRISAHHVGYGFTDECVVFRSK